MTLCQVQGPRSSGVIFLRHGQLQTILGHQHAQRRDHGLGRKVLCKVPPGWSVNEEPVLTSPQGLDLLIRAASDSGSDGSTRCGVEHALRIRKLADNLSLPTAKGGERSVREMWELAEALEHLGLTTRITRKGHLRVFRDGIPVARFRMQGTGR
jgi:hypothetical protein